MTPHLVTPEELVRDPFYPQLKEHVVGSTGLAYYDDKDSDLAQRLGARLASIGLHDCGSYLEVLRDPVRGRAESDALIAAITIGETCFFRHPEHFDAVRDRILPGLIERNREKRSLRIWCAGCADGQEPYSLAILLKTEMAAALEGWQVSILGTDINKISLTRARQARFEQWAFRSTPDYVRSRCFRKEGTRWTLLPEYREGVSFQYHNLVEHPFPSLVNSLSGFDLIVCRNVMIYFGPDRMRAMIGQFFDCLVPGGWLLVGPSEPNMTFFTSFRMVNAPGVTLYQRPEASAGGTRNNRHVTALLSPAPELSRPNSFDSGPFRPRPAIAARTLPQELEEIRRQADCGAWESAVRRCEELIEKEGRNATLHFYRGLVLDQMQRHVEAERSLRRAIELDRNAALPPYYLGLLLQSRGDLRGAAKCFEGVVDLLRGRDDADVLDYGDGITAAELRSLAGMHVETLRERV